MVLSILVANIITFSFLTYRWDKCSHNPAVECRGGQVREWLRVVLRRSDLGIFWHHWDTVGQGSMLGAFLISSNDTLEVFMEIVLKAGLIKGFFSYHQHVNGLSTNITHSNTVWFISNFI